MAKNYKKYFVVIIFVCIFLLSGCASVNYSRKIDHDGSIEDSVTVSLDTDALTKAGINVDNLLNKIKADIDTYFFRNISIYLQLLTSPISNTANKNLTYEEKEYILNNIVLTAVKDESSIKATILYKNEKVFNAYYNWISSLTEEEKDSSNVNVDKGAFLHKVVQKADSVFGNINEEGVAKELYNDYLEYLKALEGFSIDDVSFQQSYITTNIKLKSNADAYFVFDGLGFHVWKVDPTKGKTLKFFKNVPNVISWYILAIGISIVVVILVIWKAFNQQRDIYKQILGID